MYSNYMSFDLNRTIERTLMTFAFGVGVCLFSFATGYHYAFREMAIKNTEKIINEEEIDNVK